MVTTQPNPDDTFTLARYAHDTLFPIADAMTSESGAYAELQISLSFGGKHPGVDVWVYSQGASFGVLVYEIKATKADVDAMAAKLPALWAAKFGVTA